jgi:hypothetical protein
MNSNSRHNQIEQRLRTERPARKVIDALPARPSPGLSSTPFERPAGPRLAWAGLLAALTFATWLIFSPKVDHATPVAAAHPEPSPAPPTLNLPTVNLHQVQALTAKIDEPLERELQLVLSDTRNAIRFVASNFLPEN